MHKLRVIGVDMGSDECIPHVEIVNDDGKVIGVAYGERNARLFAEADDMFDLIKDFAENENFDYDSYKYAEKLIERVEDSPELTFDGLTMRELLESVVKSVEVKNEKR